MQQLHSMLWRRLDLAGHDACSLHEHEAGWQLDGTALFMSEDGKPTLLRYLVACNNRWHSSAAKVDGWSGNEAVSFDIRRTEHGTWMLNGQPFEGLDHCIDLDLGFTPATNCLAIRRLALSPGQIAQTPAAWLDLDTRQLSELPQQYERTGPDTYDYKAPRYSYEESLHVDSFGFVIRYPRLWQAEQSCP